MFLLATVFTGASPAAEPEPDPAELPRIPPKSPAEALDSFEIRPGFRVELAAAEPEVVDPVAIAFDAAGRMFVVEMRGYPEKREEALGRVKLLEDRDGDGRYETASVFADRLKWPTGVACWRDGVFVTASPDILFLRDADGDGVAEERQVVFTGFGAGQKRLNMQALVNGLQWGPDGRIYGSTGRNGGRAGGLDTPVGERLDLRGADFSFDPEARELRRESGTAQFGLAFDDAGRRYLCSNSRHLIAVIYSWPWNEVAGLPHPLVDIPVDGGAAEVFRISKVEPWRVVRTRWRVQGLVKGPVEGGGRAAGYFTSASGLTVYRGDAFPAEFRGNAFVGDVGSNLVHRKMIEFPGNRVQPVARRAPGEEKREFLASTDNWFRPVQCANGPDGALYVVDMCRETIEHPWSLPESIKKHLDLYSGTDRGRIWRVVPEGFKRPEGRDLGEMSTVELREFLEGGNGWARDTASRLLKERGLAADAGTPGSLAEMISDPDPRVRFEAALQCLDPKREVDTGTLAKLLEGAAGDPWLVKTTVAAAKRHALLGPLVAMQDELETVVAILQAAGDAKMPAGAAPWLKEARAVLRSESADADQRATALQLVARDPNAATGEFWNWIDRGDPVAAEVAAAGLARRPPATWEAGVAGRWPRLAPSIRRTLLDAMSDGAVLAAVRSKAMRREEIGYQRQRALRTSRDARIREAATALLGAEAVRSREDAARHFRPALRMEGDPAKGKAVFTERCALCHAADRPIGPALAALRNKGAPMLLENLIAPDLEVAPEYLLWEVEMKDGTRRAGMIGEERGGSFVLTGVDGSRTTITRDRVERLANLDRSLMPAGLEAGLSLEAMADLLEYLAAGE